MALSLSSRQYPMLQTFLTGVSMSIEQAQHYDQRPFRSMLVRGWVGYRPGRGFHITHAGRQAYETFTHTEIQRKNALAPLTQYFDPLNYGLRQVARSKADKPARPQRAAA